MDSSPASRESRHHHFEAGGSTSDRISDLSDDSLLAILQNLDSRTAFAAAALSRRWRHLPASLTTLRLTTDDFLPRPYRELCFHKNSMSTHETISQEADGIRAVRANDKHERQAMQALARCVSDLELHYKTGPDGTTDELRLELYMMHYIWSTPRRLSPADLCYFLGFSGPHNGLRTSGPRLLLQSVALNSRFLASLQSLSLNNVQLDEECILHILKNCRQVKSLHLESCYIGLGAHLRIDVPGSELRELVLLECRLMAIELIRAPKLQRLVYSGRALPISYGSVSCLAHVFLDIWNSYMANALDLNMILCNNIAHIENLSLSFAGMKPHRWNDTKPLCAPLSRLISLDVSCIPPCCDLLWLSLIIRAAPFLERLQITATEEEGWKAMSWKPSEFRHYHLKELQMIGFVGEAAQVNFIRFVMERSAVLNTVVLVDGLARMVHLWNHKFCIPQWCRSNEEKVAMVKQLKDGSSSTAQIVLR